jgi:hypothetical protein
MRPSRLRLAGGPGENEQNGQRQTGSPAQFSEGGMSATSGWRIGRTPLRAGQGIEGFRRLSILSLSLTEEAVYRARHAVATAGDNSDVPRLVVRRARAPALMRHARDSIGPVAALGARTHRRRPGATRRSTLGTHLILVAAWLWLYGSSISACIGRQGRPTTVACPVSPLAIRPLAVPPRRTPLRPQTTPFATATHFTLNACPSLVASPGLAPAGEVAMPCCAGPLANGVACG